MASGAAVEQMVQARGPEWPDSGPGQSCIWWHYDDTALLQFAQAPELKVSVVCHLVLRLAPAPAVHLPDRPRRAWSLQRQIRTVVGEWLRQELLVGTATDRDYRAQAQQLRQSGWSETSRKHLVQRLHKGTKIASAEEVCLALSVWHADSQTLVTAQNTRFDPWFAFIDAKDAAEGAKSGVLRWSQPSVETRLGEAMPLFTRGNDLRGSPVDRPLRTSALTVAGKVRCYVMLSVVDAIDFSAHHPGYVEETLLRDASRLRDFAARYYGLSDLLPPVEARRRPRAAPSREQKERERKETLAELGKISAQLGTAQAPSLAVSVFCMMPAPLPSGAGAIAVAAPAERKRVTGI